MEWEKLMASADYLIIYVTSHGNSLNLIKLQRLLYLAYAWHLAFSDGQAMFRENFQAWRYGPVNGTLQKHFSALADPTAPIDLTQRHYRNPLDALEKLTDEEIDNFELIGDVYGDLSPEQLEEMLFSDEPWVKARDGLSPESRSDSEITDAAILQYYRDRLEL